MVLDGLDESGEYPKNDRFGVCQAPLRRPREHIAFGMYSQRGEEVERLDRRSKHQDSSYDGREAFWQKQSLLRRIKSRAISCIQRAARNHSWFVMLGRDFDHRRRPKWFDEEWWPRFGLFQLPP